MPSKDKTTPQYETKLTLSQEEVDGPLQFQMDWSPPLTEFAKEGTEIPATHALMQNIFMNTLLPLTAPEDDTVRIEVETTPTLQ